MDEKVLKDQLRLWELEAQLQFLKAEIFVNGQTDKSQWMNKAQQWLNNAKQKADGLPENDPKRKELKMAILRNIDIAQARHKENDSISTRAYIAKIEADWENVEVNVLIEKSNKVRSDNSIRGKKPKRKEWALEVAIKLKEKYPNMTKEKAWLMIPSTENKEVKPIEVETDQAEYNIYTDGIKLIAVNTLTMKESTITKETFFTEYYKKGK